MISNVMNSVPQRESHWIKFHVPGKFDPKSLETLLDCRIPSLYQDDNNAQNFYKTYPHHEAMPIGPSLEWQNTPFLKTNTDLIFTKIYLFILRKYK